MIGETTTTIGTPVTVHAPIIIDLGEKSKKSIKRLRKGNGKLLAQVQDAIRELQTGGRIGANVQTVIVVVEREPDSFLGW